MKLLKTIGIIFGSICVVISYFWSLSYFWDKILPNGLLGGILFFSLASAFTSVFFAVVWGVCCLFSKEGWRQLKKWSKLKLSMLLLLLFIIVLCVFNKFGGDTSPWKEVSEKDNYTKKAYQCLDEGDNEQACFYMAKKYKKFADIETQHGENYLTTLNAYGLCLAAVGEIDSAFCMYRKAYRLNMSATEINPHELYFSLLGECSILFKKKEYTQARQSIEEIGELSRQYPSVGFIKYIYLSMYSKYYQTIGATDKYEQTLSKLIEELLRYNDVDELLYEDTQIDLLKSYCEHQKMKEASLLFLGMEIKEESNHYIDYLYAGILIANDQNAPKQAKRYLQKILDILEEQPDANPYKIAKSRLALALFYSGTPQGEPYFQDILSSMKSNAKIMNQPEGIKIYYNCLLNYLVHQKKQQLAIDTLQLDEIQDYLMYQIKQEYLYLPANERGSYVSSTQDLFRTLNSLYLTLGDSYVSTVVRNELFTNMLSYELDCGAASLLKTTHNEYLLKKLKNMEQWQQNLDLLDKQGVFVDKLLSLAREKGDLLHQEIDKNICYLIDNRTNISWEELSCQLGKKEAFVLFSEFFQFNGTTIESAIYALVMTNHSAPKIRFLCKTNVLETLLTKNNEYFFSPVTRIDSLYQGRNGQELYDLIWSKIALDIQECEAIRYIPISKLHEINPELLPLPGGGRLSERYEFHRQFSSDMNKPTNVKSALLVGDIPFEKTTTAQLPGTQKEVVEMEYLLKKQIPTTLLTGSMATEAAFRKELLRQPDLIHIATHTSQTVGNGGLLLASASGDSTSCNTLLTTDAISKMYIPAQLVVLSACGTGLGASFHSEGVFGLQRAFRIAGAKTLLVSLWNVPDEATAQLMKYFYQSLMKGLSVHESLHRAQKELRNSYTSPFYWGGFIVVE